MRQVMVRYRVKPERVDENERLVRGVYEELRQRGVDAFTYATYRLDDGVTFVHVAHERGDRSPLPALPAFQRFLQDIAERCDEQPVVSVLQEIGSYSG